MIGSQFARAFLALLIVFSFSPACAFASQDQPATVLEAERFDSREASAVGDDGAEGTPSSAVEEPAVDEPDARPLPQALSTLAGSGTQQDPYLLGTRDDLEAFRLIVDSDPSVHAKMTADIAVGDWTPIKPASGYVTEAFCGTFDGCGHSITAMSVSASDTNVGFFGVVNGATIKNLHVAGQVSSSKAYVGGIVGKLDQGIMANCSFSGSVSTGVVGSTGYAGGLVGYAGNSASKTASISGCWNAGTVTGGVAGGIAGYAKFTTIADSYNTGSISGSFLSGGISGQVQNNGIVERCYSTGAVSGSGTAADIVDFLYSSAAIDTCGYVVRATGAGTGQVANCAVAAPTAEFAAFLGSAFNQGADGYPVLAWQGGTKPEPADPGTDPDPDPEEPTNPVDPEPDEPTEAERSLEEMLAGLTKLNPVYGQDSNIVEMVAQKCPGASVTLLSVERTNGTDECSDISDSGDIVYFYADPASSRGQWNGSFKVRLAFALGEAMAIKELSVIVPWDVSKVESYVREEVIELMDLGDLSNVVDDLSLPKYVEGKSWVEISWASSNASCLSIEEPQGGSSVFYSPYIGKVRCGEQPQAVTLTASIKFNRTATYGESPLVFTRDYSVTIASLEGAKVEQIKRELTEKLNAGFSKAGLRDQVTGELLAFDGTAYVVENDIQLPTTRDFGVDGKYYPVTLATSNAEVLTVPEGNNNARAYVLRPVGMDAAAVLSVTLTDNDTNVAATKEFPLRVKAIDPLSLTAEFALMETVKAHYFDGLNAGANPAADEIYADLTPFFEVYAEDGELVWVRSNEERRNTGIVAVAQEGWEELESWRLFKSSNAKVISHENLLVNRQSQPKHVTVSSVLSHEVYGKYGELYAQDPVKYAAYAPFAALYNVPVSVELTVRGTTDPTSTMVRAATVATKFAVTDGSSVLYSGIYQGLPEGATAWDVFKQLVPAGSYGHQGSYVSSITGPDGQVRAEKSRGPNSGWLYSVNGQMPGVAMGSYVLEDGDELVLFFTEDGSAFGHWEWPAESGSAGEGALTEATGGVPVYENWTQVPDLAEGQQVLIRSQDGAAEQVTPLTVGGASYLPLAPDDEWFTVADDATPLSGGSESEAGWLEYWWLVLVGAVGGGAVVALVRRHS